MSLTNGNGLDCSIHNQDYNLTGCIELISPAADTFVFWSSIGLIFFIVLIGLTLPYWGELARK